MRRRQFLEATVAVSLATFLRGVPVGALPAGVGYGPLNPADGNGVALPDGFTYRVVATTGNTVGPTNYVFPAAPDGAGTFRLNDGGWLLLSNSEVMGSGGVSSIRFNAAGSITEARRVLANTNRNCSGGATPWWTWLSCEEVGRGRVFEVEPFGAWTAERPGLGRFNHEAAVVDPSNHDVYLTEDEPDGCLYRFRPTNRRDLGAGELQVMVEVNGQLSWDAVPDPSGSPTQTRNQVANAKRFNGGEGAWFAEGRLLFTTKGDNRIWEYRPSTNQLTEIYHRATSVDKQLLGVDAITVSPTGDLFVCEDGGNMELIMIRNGEVSPFFRLDVAGSELVGAVFNPDGNRLYVGSQRNPGQIFEISGPFSGAAPPPPADTERPSTPRGLTVDNAWTRGTVLSWTGSTDNVGVAGYHVFNADSNAEVEFARTTSKFVGGLTPGTTYRFYVKAVDDAGNQSWRSNIVTVTTQA